jgi:hypothetical protein
LIKKGEKMEKITNLRSFILVMIGVLGFFGLALYKDVAVDDAIPTLIGMYVASRAASMMSSGWAASKDPNADTVKVLESQKNMD